MGKFIKAGTIPPSRVYDANGVELLYVTEFCVETGECKQVACDANGVIRVDPKMNELPMLRLFHPAPLRIEEIEITNGMGTESEERGE